MARRPGFAITVTTVDQASAGLSTINKAISRLSVPAEKFNREVRSFGDVTGMTRMTEGVRGMSRGMLDGVRSADRLLSTLGVITGVTSLAGIAALANRWREVGTELSLVSQRLGISAGALSRLQGAAQLGGASAEAMSAGLRGLGETLRDATFGRNSDAIQMFELLGIRFKDTAGNARDMTDVLPEVADKIASIRDPFTQARIATTLFGEAGEALLPLLRRGSRGIQELADQAVAFGNVTPASAQAAADFTLAITKMELAVAGLANAIITPLAPALTQAATLTAEWTAANREWLATDLVDGIKRTAREVDGVAQSLGGWKSVGEDLLLWWGAKFLPGIIGGAVRLHLVLKNLKSYLELGPRQNESLGDYQGRRQDQFGDWMERNLGIRPGLGSRILGGAHGAGGIADLSGDTATTQERTATAQNFFSMSGYSPAQVAGILSYIRGESGFDPDAFNPAGGGQGAQGVAQWRGPRVDQFRAMFGRDPRGAPLMDQYRFIAWELQNTERMAGAALNRARTPEEAADVMTRQYGRPEADQVDRISRQRQEAARAYMVPRPAHIIVTPGVPGPPAAAPAILMPGVTPAPAAATPAPAAPAPGILQPGATSAPGIVVPGSTPVPAAGIVPGGRVQVDVTLRNAPPGTTASATASGTATAPPPRIEQTLPYGGL